MLLVISADAEIMPSMFVFEGKRLLYRVRTQNGDETVQTNADCLPRESIVSMRPESGRVDTQNFFLWSKHFILNLMDLAGEGRKVLLKLDGYRSHMSVTAIEMLGSNN